MATGVGQAGAGRVVAMIIARMGSTRLPGKSLIEVASRPLLDHMIAIARRMNAVDEIAVVTSSLAADDLIADRARALGVKACRGHPEYVLDRIHRAAEELAADVVVYLGGDCPLLDPGIVDRGVAAFFERGCDYLNNYDPPTFPEGMDVNVITTSAVVAAYERALAPSQRIHAFSYLTNHPDEFVVSNFNNDVDLSRHHWSLDFPEDLAFVRAVYDRLYREGQAIRIADVLALIERDEAVASLDRKLQRGEVAHAFCNSPGIMRDMNADILALSAMAGAAALGGDHDRARRCRNEIARIERQLARFAAIGTAGERATANPQTAGLRSRK
jgi:spore coat polysaccharide biosynthesis protein SpsF (cytidylyltransferase family)